MDRTAKKSAGIKRRGFASMDPAKLKEISAKGGRASKGGGRKKQGKKAGESRPDHLKVPQFGT